MTNYSMYKRPQKENPAKKPIHPVWRGIGCILLVLIPAISYIAAEFIVINRSNVSWVIIPAELILKDYKDPLILVKLVYTVIFVFILYLILTVITFAINKLFGPDRYGPLDVPLDKVVRK